MAKNHFEGGQAHINITNRRTYIPIETHPSTIARRDTYLEEALSIPKGAQVLGGNLLKARLAGHGLLEKDTSSTEHSQASVLELLQLQLRKLVRVILKGIEVQPEPEVARGLVLRVLLPDRQLNHADGGQDLQPRGAGKLSDGLEARGDLPIIQGMVDLGEPQAQHGNHGQSAVLELWTEGWEGGREGGRYEYLVLIFQNRGKARRREGLV